MAVKASRGIRVKLAQVEHLETVATMEDLSVLRQHIKEELSCDVSLDSAVCLLPAGATWSSGCPRNTRRKGS